MSCTVYACHVLMCCILTLYLYRGASDEFTASTETQLSQYAEETLIIRPDVRGSDINTVYYYSLIIV